MGERLGVLEALIRDGISPIPAEDGIEILRQILADPSTPTAMVVMGRVDGLPTVAFDRPELPLLRFVDRLQVHYPGVELVVDTDLSAGGDLYLADHLLDGDLLFPAVLGMEAMAQAAAALTGRWDSPVLENMEFLRPIVVPPNGTATIRIAALVTGPGVVTAVIRAADTGFQADHFRATLRFGVDWPADAPAPTGPAELLAVSPASELYGPVLFQGKRFQRLIGYRQLCATHCAAEISNTPTDRWFAAYLPDDLVLADPGTRDCAMHAIQCDVPDATLLPTAVERLYLADRRSSGERPTVVVHAAERFRDGDTYVYDVDVRDPAGALVERWSGLELRAVRRQDGSGPWLPALLGPYLERRAESVTTVPLRCVVRPDGVEPGSGVALRRHRTASAVSWATDGRAVVRYRPDGRPELDGGATMSAAHGSGVTFVIVSPAGRRVGCDVEPVVDRSARDWANLLGADQVALARLLAEERGEPLPVAATRVWGAMECLRKTGWAGAEPVTGATGVLSDWWALLRSGSARIATFVTRLKDVARPVVFTMLTEEDD
jgi:enediyne polyketide synthase